jgi:predicted metal-binding membrane protein
MMAGMMLPSASPLLLLYGAAATFWREHRSSRLASDLRARRRLHCHLGALQRRRDGAAAHSLYRWRWGSIGAFRMGVDHGIYCVGCCWALMLLLFVGGIMNLTVIVALTVFVAVEKLLPIGAVAARVCGAALIAAAGWMLVR